MLYSVLLVCCLGFVCGATLLLLKRSLIGGLDESLADTNRQFVSIVGQLALDDPITQAETAQAGYLPRARYMFANDLIQIERLEFLNREQLLAGIAGNNIANSYDNKLNNPNGTNDARPSAQAQVTQAQENFLQLVRNVQSHTRLIATGAQTPIVLSDPELIALIQSPNGRLLIERDIPQAFQEKKVPYRILVSMGQVEWSEFELGMPLQAMALTPVITYVGRSMAGVQDTLQRLQKVFLILMLGVTVLAGLGAFALAGRALRPLQLVRQAAEGIGGQTLTERVPEPDSGDEVQALALSLNKMLDRLEHSFEAQRRFTSDASHELRTPVTAISGHASYLLRRTNPSEQAKESLGIIKDESERLSNLIASLLDLARSDNGMLVLHKQPIFSQHFLRSIAKELEPIASAQATCLEVIGSDILFEGDQDRLKQVIINLVSNAIKAQSNLVTLSSQSVNQTQGQQILFSVTDNGTGIPAEHLQRLFDRFYRVQDSRSRDKGGAGLGLSIAHGIVLSHQGKIWLESQYSPEADPSNGVGPDSESSASSGTTAYVQLPIGDLPVLEDEDVP